MGQSYYTCECCEEAFGDYSDYEVCDCGKKWCCEDCASDDGFRYETEDDGYKYNESCNYCRKEDFSNDSLLEKALELLNISREELISKMK